MSSRVSTSSQSRPVDELSPGSTSCTLSSASQPSCSSTSLSSRDDPANDTPLNPLTKAQSHTHTKTECSENQPQSASHTNVTVADSQPSTPRPTSKGQPRSSSSSLHAVNPHSQNSPPKVSRFAKPTELRSPALKRAPASRSSHGIETSSGPPPALSTQRSYTAESTRRVNPPQEPTQPHPTAQRGGGPAVAKRPASSSGVPQKDGMFNRRSRRTSVYEEDEDRTLTLRDSEGEQGGDDTISSQEDIFLNLAQQDAEAPPLPRPNGERRRSHIDPPTRTQPRMSASRPQSSGRLFPSEASTTAPRELPQGHTARRDLGTDSTFLSQTNSPRNHAYAASAHPLDHGLQHRPGEYEPKTSYVSKTRRGSEQGDSCGLPSKYEGGRPARFQESFNGLYHSSPLTRHSTVNARRSNRISHSFDTLETGSTVSTTAQSTVRDEIEEVKSRLMRIEAGAARMPQSSQQAINNKRSAQQPNHRPATASTTMTTISSSPKHKRGNYGSQTQDPSSADSSTLKGAVDPNIHPLLHTALTKVNALLSPEAYKSLEASATDALRLVIMTKDIKNPQPSDRQIRRKADSLCRSLTELCIALSENFGNNSTTRPHQHPTFPPATTTTISSSSHPGGNNEPAQAGSTYHSANSSPTLKPTFSVGQDTELARASSRVMSRIEARRSSLQIVQNNGHSSSIVNGRTSGSGTPTAYHRKGSSPVESLTPASSQPTPSSSSTVVTSRPFLQRGNSQQAAPPPSRATSLLLRRKTRSIGGLGASDADNSSDVGSGSGAGDGFIRRNNTSRLARERNREQQQQSREYTSTHPLPRFPTSHQHQQQPYQQQQQQQHQASPEIRPSLPTRRSYFHTQYDANNNDSSPITPARVISSGTIADQVRRKHRERSSAEKATPPPQQQQQQQLALIHNHHNNHNDGDDDMASMVSTSAAAAGGRRRSAQGQGGQYPSSDRSRLLLGATARPRRSEHPQ